MDEQQEAPPPAESDTTGALAALTTERDEARNALADYRERYAGAVGSLLQAARHSNPTIPGELIAGETPEEIAASIAKGTQIRDAILTANVHRPGTNGHAVSVVPTIPAGGGAAPPNVDRGLSPYEKIKAAMAANAARTV